MADYQSALLRRMIQKVSAPNGALASDDLAIDAAIKRARGSNAVVTQPDGQVMTSSAWLQFLENTMVSGVSGAPYSGLSWQCSWGT